MKRLNNQSIGLFMNEISSLQNPLIKHLVKLRQNSDYRYDHHALVIEGSQMIQEVLPYVTFKTVLASSAHLIPEGLKAQETILTTPSIIQKVSGLKSSEGIIAEVLMPKQEGLKNKKYIVALDKINDPGNLGTILRTSLALGWEGVFLLDESCDPYNDKALRASRGAVFKLPIVRGNWKDLQKIVNDNHLTPFVADVQGKSFKEISPVSAVLLVLGNEAHGPSEESLTACQAITIPMPGHMESLNVSVAAGILLNALRNP